MFVLLPQIIKMEKLLSCWQRVSRRDGERGPQEEKERKIYA